MVQDRKKILFVCIENACRSQMAEGFARKLAEGRVEVYSAGSKPSGVVNPTGIDVMRERGIDLTGQRSKGFKDLPVKEFDYVVTLGCGDVCPFVPGKERLDWQIPDPKGKPVEFFREVRDTIEREVGKLLETIQ